MIGARTALVSLAAASVAAVAQAYRPGDQICSYASGSTCALDQLGLSPVDGSALIYPGGRTRCAFDDFTDDKSTFKTNATYFFQVFPKQERKKLLIFLQGGGACVDSQTCNFALQCGYSTFTTVANAGSTGILNATDPENVFRDWNVVHIPYCTGDLHVGNRVLEATESGIEAIFGKPQCLGRKQKAYLNGFENTKSAIQWARANYPDVEELVLGGASAGSLAAQVLAAYVADKWNVQQSGAHYAILADSYVGVLPAEKPSGKVLNYYGTCDADLKLPTAVTTGCKAETLTVSELGSAMLKALPQSDWLFINSMGDRTQRFFYQLTKDGIFGYPFPNLLSESELYSEMNKILDTYKAVSSHISTYFVNGDQHVFLLGSTYYKTVSTTGKRLGEYLAQWLAQSVEPSPPSSPTPSPSPSTPTTSPSSSSTAIPSSSPSLSPSPSSTSTAPPPSPTSPPTSAPSAAPTATPRPGC